MQNSECNNHEAINLPMTKIALHLFISIDKLYTVEYPSMKFQIYYKNHLFPVFKCTEQKIKLTLDYVRSKLLFRPHETCSLQIFELGHIEHGHLYRGFL